MILWTLFIVEFNIQKPKNLCFMREFVIMKGFK